MQATYVYDALDRRIETDETISGTEVKTWSVYDGENVYAEFNGSGSLENRYLYGPAVDEILARTSAAGVTAWYLTDHLGSVRDVVSSSGTVLDHIAYDAYGNVTSQSNASYGDEFQYAGMRTDAATGLYYDQARWYSPVMGRFVSQDPTGFRAGDANMYRYASNNSTNAIDPSGNSIMLVATALSSSTKRPMTNPEETYISNMLQALDAAIREITDKPGGCNPNSILKDNATTSGKVRIPPIWKLSISTTVSTDTDYDALTRFPYWQRGNFTSWNSSTGKNGIFDDDSDGGYADHGFYDGNPGEGELFPTELAGHFWALTPNGMATALLHESYHSWGYWADKDKHDYAEDWAKRYMSCITATKAWTTFLNDANNKSTYNNIKKVLK